MVEQTLGGLSEDQLVLGVEAMDPLYLNSGQLRLQTGGGVVSGPFCKSTGKFGGGPAVV